MNIQAVFKSALRKVTVEDVNASLTKTRASLRPLQVGEYAMHIPSRISGTVTAVEQINGVDTASIETRDGRILRGLARAEFGLTRRESFAVSPTHDTPTAPQVIPFSGVGEISDESLLSELV